MNSPGTPATPDPGIPGRLGDSALAGGASDPWLAHALRELAAPSEALCRRTLDLLEELPDDAPPRFREAVKNMAVRAQQLSDPLRRALDPDPARPAGPRPTDRAFRHDLRGHVVFILGTCQLWTA